MSPLPPRVLERLPAAEAVVVGGSAGAIETLVGVLGLLPLGLSVPLTVVVHLRRHRPSALREVLSGVCGCHVVEPQDKEPLLAGRIYVAAPDYHLMIEPGPTFALSLDPPVHYSRPSIDVLFESAADVLGERLVAIVLSGANQDGARGLQAVCAAGGLGIVQTPAEASSPAMPAAAAAACAGALTFDTRQIRALLQSLAAPRAGAPDNPGDNRKSHA